MSKSKVFLKNSAILSFMNILGGILGYGFHAVVSRQISIQAYGELQSYIALFSALGFLSTTVNYYIIQTLSPLIAKSMSTLQFKSTLQQKVFYFSLSAILILLITTPFTAQILQLKQSYGLFLIVLTIFVNLQQFVFQGILNAHQAFWYVGSISFAGALIKFLVGFFVSVQFKNSENIAVILIYSFLLSEIMLYLGGYYFIKYKLNVTPQNTASLEIQPEIQPEIQIDVKQIAKVMLFSFGIILLPQWDMLFMKHWSLDQNTVGVYGAFALIGRLLYWICFSIIAVVLPEACSLEGGSTSQSFSVRKNAYLLIVPLGLIASLIFYLIPGLPISMFFGDKYLPYGASLWLFGLSYLLLSLVHLEASLAFSKKHFKVTFFLIFTILFETVLLKQSPHQIDSFICRVLVSMSVGYCLILFYNYQKSRKQNGTI